MLIIQYRDVAQVVERYFREVEAASSSLVIPIGLKKGISKNLEMPFMLSYQTLFPYPLPQH